jgi:hypothetical protein
LGIFADRIEYESEQELQDWLISFYKDRLLIYLNNIGGITDYNVEITPTLIRATIRRYSQLLENYNVTDW